MRRITAWMFATVAALVLLFSYRTSTNPSSAATTAIHASGTPDAVAKTYTGEAVQTKYGPVQISIVMSGGRLTDVQILQRPSGNPRNDEINGRAMPILRQETLDAQSADIDAVSGATFTTGGYLQSLQSALDAAHRN